MVGLMAERIRIIIDTSEKFRTAVNRLAQKLGLELNERVSPSDILNALIATGIDRVTADDVLSSREGQHNSREIREAESKLEGKSPHKKRSK